MWTLTYQAKPWTVNAERKGGHRTRKDGTKVAHGIGGHQGRANLTAQWRRDFWALAREAKIPRLKSISVDVHQVSKGKRRPDPGSIYPAVKAAIDGLVDAKVVPDDGPDHVDWVRVYAAEVGYEDSVTLVIAGEEA